MSFSKSFGLNWQYLFHLRPPSKPFNHQNTSADNGHGTYSVVSIDQSGTNYTVKDDVLNIMARVD